MSSFVRRALEVQVGRGLNVAAYVLDLGDEVLCHALVLPVPLSFFIVPICFFMLIGDAAIAVSTGKASWTNSLSRDVEIFWTFLNLRVVNN